MNEEHRRLNNLSARLTDDYLRRSSVTYLECVVGLMLTHMTKEEVARMLEAQAKMVRELD